MKNRSAHVKRASALLLAVSCMALSTIGGADSVLEKKAPSIADQTLFFAPVPKAVCGPGDTPETALQGQVPAAMRAAGFQGFSCNLQLIGQLKGEGANWQSAEWRQGSGVTKQVCAYHGTAAPNANPTLTRTNLGVRVIDITDPSNPTNTAYLTTTSMLDPWESLKINERRQLLGAVNGADGGGGPQIDIYDVSGDCRHPQLLASTSLSKPDGTPIIGHEGSWAPDGLTYYGGDLRYSPAGAVPGNTGQYYAVDTTDTTNPQFITSWQTGIPGANVHGMSISTDGTRGYMVSLGFGGNAAQLLDPTVAATNGLLIFDLSDIQARKPNPQVKLISKLLWKDGAGAQHTIPVTIGKKPYIIFVDEAGSGGFGTAAAYQSACDAGLPPFNMARIIDISDETNPKIVSELMLETHDPANCNQVLPDIAGSSHLHVHGTATTAAWTTGIRRRRSPAAISIPAFAYSTSATRCGREKSRITTRRARRRLAQAPITIVPAVGLPAARTGVHRPSTSMRTKGHCGRRARTRGFYRSSSRITRGRFRKARRRRAPAASPGYRRRSGKHAARASMRLRRKSSS